MTGLARLVLGSLTVSTSTQKERVYILRADAIKLVFATFKWTVERHNAAHTQIIEIMASLGRMDRSRHGNSWPEVISLAGGAIRDLATTGMYQPLSEFQSVVCGAFQDVFEPRSARFAHRPVRPLPGLVRLNKRDWETCVIGLENTSLVLNEAGMLDLGRVCGDWRHHTSYRGSISLALGELMVHQAGRTGFWSQEHLQKFRQAIRDSQATLHKCAGTFVERFWPARELGLVARLGAPL